MRRASLLLLLVTSLTLAGGAPAHARARCAGKHTQTARKTADVRVYWKDAEDRLGPYYLYGCIRRSGERHELYGTRVAPNEIAHFGPLRVAGHHVAFATWSFCTVCG